MVVDPSLLKDDFAVREDLKFALGLGYKDSLATILKMDDFALFKLENEVARNFKGTFAYHGHFLHFWTVE